MSHYRVALIRRPHQDADELLAKYDENLEVEPYIRIPREKALKEAAETIQKYVDGTYKSSEGGDKLIAAQKAGEDELIKAYAEYCGRDLDKQGNQLSTYNPLSKYDYYGEIETFKSVKDYLKEHPVRNTSGHEAYKARVFWRHAVEGKPLPKKFVNDDYFRVWYKKEYYLEKYGDMKTFVRYALCNAPGYAFVLDENWYAPGEVGWFASEGNVSQTNTKNYLDAWDKVITDPTLQDAEVIIYDMHI